VCCWGPTNQGRSAFEQRERIEEEEGLGNVHHNSLNNQKTQQKNQEEEENRSKQWEEDHKKKDEQDEERKRGEEEGKEEEERKKKQRCFTLGARVAFSVCPEYGPYVAREQPHHGKEAGDGTRRIEGEREWERERERISGAEREHAR
jgi:hypothetical protein